MVKSLVQKHASSAALRLGRAAGVPNLIFMTDEQRVHNPVDVCYSLPAGSIIICRDYDHPDRIGLAQDLRLVTRELKQFLLVAGDADLARAVDADGYHMPEYQLSRPPRLTGFSLVSAACHDRRALLKAQALAVDFALVSPVFSTHSHPDASFLGVHRLARLVESVTVPIAALGGINQRNAQQLNGIRLLGVAGIGVFSDG